MEPIRRSSQATSNGHGPPSVPKTLCSRMFGPASEKAFIPSTATLEQPLFSSREGPARTEPASTSGWPLAQDDKLYALGNDGSETGLFRLDPGNHFSLVSVLPDGGLNLALGPNGDFFVSTTFGNGGRISEVWIVNPYDGISTLLASGFQSPSGIVFDSERDLLYVRDQAGQYEITAISVPTTVPEPSTLRLAALGLLLVLACACQSRPPRGSAAVQGC